MDYEEELGAFFFLLEEPEVIADSADDWESWGPFQTFAQLKQSWTKLTALPVEEALDGLGFFVLWDSVKTSLPDVCAKSFNEYPPNDFFLPGAILLSLLDPDGFDTFVENLTEYLAGLEEELDEVVSEARGSLASWWGAKRIETLSQIFSHSETFRNFLTQP